MIWWPTHLPTLRHGLITLRPAQEKDILSIYQACQDPIIPQFTTVPTPYTMSHAQSFVLEQSPVHFKDRTELLLVITHGNGEDAEFCGVISFHTTSINNHATELGYWLALPARRRGIGTAAVKLITEYGLTTIGFKRIEALVDVENIASKALLTSAGYQLEGIMRSKVTRDDGAQKDMALFARVSQ